jgi:hypothetical protein
MWQAALALMDAHLGRVLDALAAHPAYGLTLVGHSVGAGAGPLRAAPRRMGLPALGEGAVP